MRRRRFHFPVVVAMCLAALFVACRGIERASPPNPDDSTATGRTNRYNVLFLAVDDLRPELGCYAVGDARSPHIDELAASGTVFERHYVQVPTCGASRYSMLTGRSPLATGVRSGNDAFRRAATRIGDEQLAGAQTWPECFRRSGYHTVAMGKISHSPDGRLFAYDGSGDGAVEVPLAWNELATPAPGPWGYGWGAFFAYDGGRHREDGDGHRDVMEFVAADDRALPDGRIADAAVARLRGFAATGERFVLAVGFYKPHLPHVATQNDWRAFDAVDVAPPQLPSRIASPYWHRSGEYMNYDLPFAKSVPLDGAAAICARRAYLACVRYVDRQIGRVLDALEDADLAKDTVVIVWGDHGWHLGEQSIWGKHSPFERSARSALIIRVPGSESAPRRTRALAESTDLYPTLLDLCRPSFQTVEHELDGISLVPVLRGEAVGVRDRALTVQGRVRSVRTTTHRLIYTSAKDGAVTDVELYDLTDRADSSTNVAAQQPEIVASLLAR